MKRIFAAVSLSVAFSSLVSAQTPTPASGVPVTNERGRAESATPTPSPVTGEPAQPRPRLAPEIPIDLIQLDEAKSEANKLPIPYIPPNVLANPRGGGGGRYASAYDARRSLSLFDKGMIEQAKARAEDILQQLPKPYRDEDFFARGVAHYVLREYDVAIAELEKAIHLGYIEAYFIQGRAYADKGDYDRVINEYQKTIQLYPQDAFAYHIRGYAYSCKGDYDRAIADYSAAIRFAPAFILAYQNRAQAYEKMGDKAKAQADRDKAVELERQGREP